METLLKVNNLKTFFHTPDGVLRAVDDVSFSVKRGETLGIVGESGCGKSVTCHSILRLVPTSSLKTPPPAQYANGAIIFDGEDILKMDHKKLLELRGRRIAMIFQDSLAALNPVYTIGNQIREALRLHLTMSRAEANARALELLQQVHIHHAEKILNSYPFSLSGGMRQRVMIAMALSCKPDLLIADEPTTALDVTVQAQIIALINQLKEETGSAVIFVSHDLGVISEIADRIMVMYAGKVCETATTDKIIFDSRHPYTQGLIASQPSGLPTANNRLLVIPGNVPSLLEKPHGCPFHPRCRLAQSICTEQFPETKAIALDHTVACWHVNRQMHEEGNL